MRKNHPSPGEIFLRSLVGVLGGISATGPMTIGMICLHRHLPYQHRYALPPREITLHVAQALDLHRKLSPTARAALTLTNHFGYGALAASVYSLVEARAPGSPIVKGPLFGALVWLVSYLGLLPATGLLEPATEHPGSRNALMLAVHLLWGLVVGIFVETILSERKSAFGALVAGSPLPHRDRK